jgi:hypothetical protein
MQSVMDQLRTNHIKGETHYWILYYTFFSPQKSNNAEEIIEQLCAHMKRMCARTYYLKKQKAVDEYVSVLQSLLAKDNKEIFSPVLPQKTKTF